MDKRELAVLCFLHSIKGLGNRTIWKIKNFFGSFETCFTASTDKLYSSGLPALIVEKIIEARRVNDPGTYFDEILANGFAVCTVEDSEYPYMLLNIPDPPYLFYYKGDIEVAQGFCIAVVGSRLASNYGRTQARFFGRELSRFEVVVVSGMARGVDSEAHYGALDGGGKTIAVLGSGLDIIYPREHRNLFRNIAENGAVISEFSLHTPPDAGNFPARNRIISGLCRGVLIVEARKKSGALITTDFALEQGRDVFALPGPINSKNSEGTNSLIKQGAKLVTGIEDILEEYNFDCSQPRWLDLHQGELFTVSREEFIIIDRIGNELVHFDELIKQTSLEIGDLSALLLKMELKGMIESRPGNYYVKI